MTIDPARFVAAALQARVAAQGAQKGLSRKPTPSAGGLAGTVTQRVQAIPADDPQRRRKALRVFLEALFLREFGGGLVQDPAFADLVQAVQEQMEADEALRRASQSLSDLLLAGKVAV
ncbi:MAG TPA: hypothetical protein VEA40_17785 [Ramlibacter sp.]|nr:hypothetical protein [Ramlibacter sp.]